MSRCKSLVRSQDAGCGMAESSTSYDELFAQKFENKVIVETATNNEKTNKKNYRQIYRKDWEVNPLFKDWLSSVSCDKYKAICIACKKELLAHRLTLLKHASSAKHINKLNMLNKNKSLMKSQEIESDKKAIKTIDEDSDSHIIDDHSDAITEHEQLEIRGGIVATFCVQENKPPKSLGVTDKESASESDVMLSHTATGSLQFENSINNVQSGLIIHEKAFETTPICSESVADNLGIYIQAESYVDIADSSEAINFKPGYVTKAEPSGKNNTTILSCASSFLHDKVDENSGDGVLNKLTAYPLQVSTRVTDYSRGISVINLSITLYKLCSGKWMCVAESSTDEVGRCNFFPKSETYFPTGCYKLHYDVVSYYEVHNSKSYFPFVEVSFLIRSPSESHHIPIMISPYGYTVYRSVDF